MKIDRTRVQALAKSFQISRDASTRATLVKELSEYIYHFPAFVFGKRDVDLQSDFYIAALERFDGFVARFDEKASSFMNYLAVCLRNLYLNLVTRRREISTISLDAPVSGGGGGENASSSTLAETLLRYEDRDPSAQDAADEETLRLQNLFHSVKNPEAYLLAKLYYFDLFDDGDFIRLKEHTGKSLGECMAFVEELMESLRIRKERRASLEYRLTRLFRKILSLQRELETSREKRGSEDIKENVIRLRERQSEYLAEYQRVRIHPSPKLLAGFFGVTESRVINHLSYFRIRSQTILEKSAMVTA